MRWHLLAPSPLAAAALLAGALSAGASGAEDDPVARARAAFATLTDSRSAVADARTAARELAALAAAERRTRGAATPLADPPLIARFHDPTLAEAMLAALERELHAIAMGDEDPAPRRAHRRETVKDWLELLVALADDRIAPLLVERARREEDDGVRDARRAAARRLERPASAGGGRG
jgi:hypothetical protein